VLHDLLCLAPGSKDLTHYPALLDNLCESLADAPVSPQDIEVDASTDDSGEHPDEDVAGAEEPSGHKRDREPRDYERAECYPDSASDLEQVPTPMRRAKASNGASACVIGPSMVDGSGTATCGASRSRVNPTSVARRARSSKRNTTANRTSGHKGRVRLYLVVRAGTRTCGDVWFRQGLAIGEREPRMLLRPR
jgi:hypothetical protein